MEDNATTKSKKLPKADRYIIGLYITLCVFSIVESYSASSREIAMAGSILYPTLKHLGLLAAGALTVYFVSRVHYIRMVPWTLLFSFLTVCAMLYAMFFAGAVNDAQRVIPLPGFTIQPAELAKIAIVFLLSVLLARFIDRKEGTVANNGLLWCAFIVTAFGGLLLLQGMTNAILFMAISFALLIVGGTKMKKLLSIIVVYIVIGLLFLSVRNYIDEHSLRDLSEEDTVEMAEGDGGGSKMLRDDTWKKRIERYKERFTGPPLYKLPTTTKNEQEKYAFMAQANGGVFGVMPGNSRECSRLPLAFSDYVFSIVVEDLGLVGGTFLVFLYFSLLILAGNIARRCSYAYPAFLVMGMALMVVLQAFFHMAINVGVFPVSGQSLPMISRGGTAILVTSLAFGVMLSVSRYGVAKAGAAKEAREEKELMPDTINADNPTKN